MQDLAQDTIDRVFADLGEACSYRAFVAGVLQPPITITAIPTSRDSVDRQWEQPRIRAESSFDIRRTEVAKPTKGSLITFAGVTYKVISDPYGKDRLGLIWVVGCSKE